MAPTDDQYIARLVAEAPTVSQAARDQIAALLQPHREAASRRRNHDITKRRRVSAELDRLCGLEPQAPDPALDRYRDSALDWEQRDAAGRRCA